MPDDRQRRIDRAALTGLGARMLSIAAQFATVPLALSALGTSDFGVWAVVTSMLGILVFLDFGIGNGAMGRITEALAAGDPAKVATLIRTTYLLLFAIALAIVALVALLYYSGLLDRMAGSSGSFLALHVELLAAFIAAYALIIPCSFVQRLYFAYQRAGWATVMHLAFSAAYLLFVTFAASRHWTLSVLVMGYVTTMLVVYACFSAATFHYFPLAARKGGPMIDAQLMRSLLKDSGLFFLLQATVAIVYNSDQLILTSFVDASSVAVYAAVFKLFGVVIMINGLLLGPLWPAISDAIARNDEAWVRSAYRANLRRSLRVSIALAGLLMLTGNLILDLWTGGRLAAPFPLLALMALWVVLEGYGQCMAMLLNAKRMIRLQVIVASCLLCAGTLLKLSVTSHLGIYGPVAATIVAFVAIVAIPETYIIRRLLGTKQ